ncbi:MAG: 2OG-Fe(II) oxygenase [Rhodospirillales bacterium]|nr:2OG-Fe(II) oxygenase [Rhodospirillales bacterium]
MTYFDLEGFRAARARSDPFPHLVMEGFLRPEHHTAVDRDFPEIRQAGSFDPSSLALGPAMCEALDELRGEAAALAVAEKFGIDLRDRPTTITLRGQARAKDGRIHADSKDKLVTLLIYLNPGWAAETGSGCLRLLRSATEIEDYETEVPARMGTLVAFPCAPNAWHGHLPYVGQRRSIQLNWVVDEGAAERTRTRHLRSALWKRVNPFGHRAN